MKRAATKRTAWLIVRLTHEGAKTVALRFLEPYSSLSLLSSGGLAYALSAAAAIGAGIVFEWPGDQAGALLLPDDVTAFAAFLGLSPTF